MRHVPGARRPRGWRAVLVSLALVAGAAAGCGGSDPPIIGKKRGELCDRVKSPPPFRCPAGASQRGGPPPEGAEMWCQRKDGVRQGPYRRFPPGSEPAGEEQVGPGVVVGEYHEDRQHGAWYTPRAGVDTVNVQFFEKGSIVQRIQCRVAAGG